LALIYCFVYFLLGPKVFNRCSSQLLTDSQENILTRWHLGTGRHYHDSFNQGKVLQQSKEEASENIIHNGYMKNNKKESFKMT